jgi:hypothetical protein
MPELLSLSTLEHLYTARDFSGLRTWALLVHREEEIPEAGLYAALALAELGEPAHAVRELQTLARTHGGTRLAEAATVTVADVYMDDLPRLAVTHYQQYLVQHPEGRYRERVTRQIARGLARDGHFAAAAQTLTDAGISVPDALQEPVETGVKWRQPVGAAVLSALIPGAGQLYAGSPKEALAAVVVNGVLAAGVVTTIQRRNWGAVGAIGFFGVGFYAGNIYGGADAAVRYNRALRDALVRSMEAQGFGPPAPLLPEVGWAAAGAGPNSELSGP